MADVLRIIDRLKITDTSPVYVVEKNRDAFIRVGDVFEDLHGNRFKVKGIEMFRKTCEGKDLEDIPLGLMFELVDGVEAQGNLLVRDKKDINFLFCNHPLYPKSVDEEYKKEYQEARIKHPCTLFSYEDLEMGNLSLYGEEISGLTIYRGWMMKPALYREFYNQLERRGIFLINSPEEYNRYHMLPGWYKDFKDVTVESVWNNDETIENAIALTEELEGSYIIKDYVKSRKHEWYDACFIKDISSKNDTNKIIGNFLKRQGSDLVGGVVLRKFQKLKKIGFHEESRMPISEEYRVFIFAGQVMIVDDYWREGEKINFSDDEKKWIDRIIKRVKSNFVTVDLARKENGELIVMELGDGQVSGLQQINPEHFYAAFEI